MHHVQCNTRYVLTFNAVEKGGYTWSRGKTLDFRPLGPRFETRCFQVWGTFIHHLIIIAGCLVCHS